MIFIGDIANPFLNSKHLNNKVFKNEMLVGNLEGSITSKESNTALYNTPESIKYLALKNVKVVSLANNHTFDILNNLTFTKKILDKYNVRYVGAGKNLEQAAKPVIIEDFQNNYIFLSYGWGVIGCKRAGTNNYGTNPLNGRSIISNVKKLREQYIDTKIILLLHWNYELEMYPQPAHRQIAMEAIDAGVDLIIGHHPHCINGVEIYKEVPIVYSLGNWFIPQGVFFDGRLTYPDIVNRQLAFQWDTSKNDFILHWFYYRKENHDVEYMKSEKLSESTEIKKLTPFEGFSHKEYISWFKRNRRKNKFLPIYKNYNSKYINIFKDGLVKSRQRAIEMMLKIGIKDGPK